MKFLLKLSVMRSSTSFSYKMLAQEHIIRKSPQFNRTLRDRREFSTTAISPRMPTTEDTHDNQGNISHKLTMKVVTKDAKFNIGFPSSER